MSTSLIRVRRRIGVAAAIATLVGSAIAADPPRAVSPGKGPFLLTPAQARECLTQQERLRTLNDETSKQQESLKADKAEIDKRGDDLKQQAAALDRTKPEAVAAYNAQVDERGKLIDEYQAAVPAFNTRVESLKAERAAFEKSCANKRYEADEAQIRKGK